MSDNCILKNDCKKSACPSICWKKYQLDFQISHSLIPKKYQKFVQLMKSKSDKDFKAYKSLAEWSINIQDKVIAGRSIYLYSKHKGNGKTAWAVRLALNYLRTLPQTVESFEIPKVLFISVPELFDSLRKSFTAPSAEMMQLDERIKTTDLVIFDDIGAEAPTQWVIEKLYIYINARESNGKSTIFTSNLSPDDLTLTLDSRIIDRIYGLCNNGEAYDIIEFKDERGR